MRLDHTSIQNVFLLEGLDGVKRLIKEGASGYSLKRALRELRKAGANGNADALEGFLIDSDVLKQRHKPARPKPGDVKGFKIQMGRGTKYLRLPVDECFPGREPGEKLIVSFDVGHIGVRDTTQTGD